MYSTSCEVEQCALLSNATNLREFHVMGIDPFTALATVVYRTNVSISSGWRMGEMQELASITYVCSNMTLKTRFHSIYSDLILRLTSDCWIKNRVSLLRDEAFVMAKTTFKYDSCRAEIHHSTVYYSLRFECENRADFPFIPPCIFALLRTAIYWHVLI